LTQSKLRPAVVLASAGKGDWILCQITSKRYTDRKAIKISKADFGIGSLSRIFHYIYKGGGILYALLNCLRQTKA
jgi:hypothetical protein